MVQNTARILKPKASNKIRKRKLGNKDIQNEKLNLELINEIRLLPPHTKELLELFEIHKIAFYKESQIILDNYRKKKWKDVFIFFRSELQFHIFLLIQDELDPITYWTFLGIAINMSIYFMDYKKILLALLSNKKKKLSLKKHLMDKKEQYFLKSLKNNIIYRGCLNKNKSGFSWTLDPEAALYFAKRNHGRSAIYKGEFSKKDVIAYFEREKEILIDPKNVKNIIRQEDFYNGAPIGAEGYRHSMKLLMKAYTLKSSIYKETLKKLTSE